MAVFRTQITGIATFLIWRGKFTEVRMDSEEGEADPLILQRRAEIKDVYTRLLVEHPALPPEIRVFQVQLITAIQLYSSLLLRQDCRT